MIGKWLDSQPEGRQAKILAGVLVSLVVIGFLVGDPATMTVR